MHQRGIEYFVDKRWTILITKKAYLIGFKKCNCCFHLLHREVVERPRFCAYVMRFRACARPFARLLCVFAHVLGSVALLLGFFARQIPHMRLLDSFAHLLGTFAHQIPQMRLF